MTQNPENLPAITATNIVGAISGIPAALIPSSVKALDRLLGAATDIPAAWLAQKKAQIDAQTQAYALVEAEIAKVAASEASATPEIVEKAVSVLVRKSYRKQINREAVAAAAIDELKSDQKGSDGEADEATFTTSTPPPELDEDWLNVFERYAEDATSERMQKLWGRVLSGEIRAPGKYSMRTLRFLSEFSQNDALSFENFSKNVFGGMAPKSLVSTGDDITELLNLEAAGLITGASGLGLRSGIMFRSDGLYFLTEGDIGIGLKGTPNTKFDWESIILTPLGIELISLLPGRSAIDSARRVLLALKNPITKEGYIVNVRNGYVIGEMTPLWRESN